MKINTSDIVAALRYCSTPGGSGCEACVFANDPAGDEPWCGDVLITEAANRLEEYVDRCARYAEEIAQLRSVDVVAVVRCEKCEHRLEPTGMCMNPMAVGWDALEPNDDDFCSRGERRADNGHS